MMKNSVWNALPERNNPHPAPFPIEIPLNIIEACSKPGDLVLDPFMGSGTTALAAKKLGRDYMGFDISKAYCESAECRLSNLE